MEWLSILVGKLAGVNFEADEIAPLSSIYEFRHIGEIVAVAMRGTSQRVSENSIYVLVPSWSFNSIFEGNGGRRCAEDSALNWRCDQEAPT